MQLKCAFHTHSCEDPIDKNISYSCKDIMREARTKGFDVIAITHHGSFFDSPEIRKFAEGHNLLFLPSIELKIEGGDVLVINATPEVEQVKTFAQLESYKSAHPECFVIAPHPYYIIHSVGSNLKKHIKKFDAIEHSHFYTKHINPNKKAQRIATQYNKPCIATSDCHFSGRLDSGFVIVEAEERSPQAIFSSLRSGKYINHTEPLKNREAASLFWKMRDLSA